MPRHNGFFSLSNEDKDGNYVDTLGNMIKTVVREHHWSPEIIGDLFIDGIDHEGLEYWYNDVCEAIAELKKEKDKK